jgi:hypothetical protein
LLEEKHTKMSKKHSAKPLKKISDKCKGRIAWNKNKQWSELQKREIGIGRRGILKWVKDESLQRIIRRDYAAAQICEEKGLFKPAIILYAGLLEALLRYKINKNEQKEFVILIEKALELKLISQTQASHMHTVRDFRNYVHIYKEVSADLEIINEGIAKLCRQLCDSIIETLKN